MEAPLIGPPTREPRATVPPMAIAAPCSTARVSVATATMTSIRKKVSTASRNQRLDVAASGMSRAERHVAEGRLQERRASDRRPRPGPPSREGHGPQGSARRPFRPRSRPRRRAASAATARTRRSSRAARPAADERRRRGRQRGVVSRGERYAGPRPCGPRGRCETEGVPRVPADGSPSHSRSSTSSPARAADAAPAAEPRSSPSHSYGRSDRRRCGRARARRCRPA